MVKSYGLPYQGSKSRIIKELTKHLPPADHFYDLFGGGGCVSHFMVANREYKQVHYNEIDSVVVALITRAVAGEFAYETFRPPWVSSKEFHVRKSTDGYVAQCWSFGNTGRTYIFGESVEEYKRSLHMAVVFSEFDDISTAALGFSGWPTELASITQRRRFLRASIDHYRKTQTLPEILYQYLSAKHRVAFDSASEVRALQQLGRLRQLEHLERLERLQQLGRLQQLVITNKDYREVEILPNSVVYCDIPYQNTGAGYCDGFVWLSFFDWAATRDFPVYISEYLISDPRFRLVAEIETRTIAGGSIEGQSSERTERLYWNGK
jgi:hypothetical protein